DYQNEQQFHRYLSIEDNFFSQNNANGSGGAVYMKSEKSVVSFHKCVFVENKAQVGHGAVSLLLSFGANVQVNQCNFTRNSVEKGHGGGFGIDVDMLMDEFWNGFQSNSRRLQNSNKVARDSPTSAPSIAPTRSPSLRHTPRPTSMQVKHTCPNITVMDCTFEQNNASLGKGGGMGMSIYQGLQCLGFHVENVTFTQNNALYGGGFAVVRQNQSVHGQVMMQGNYTAIDLKNCTFDGNSARYSGGHILFAGLVQNCDQTSVEHNVLSTYNCSLRGGSALFHGGGISAYCSSLNVQSSVIESNTLWNISVDMDDIDTNIPDNNTQSFQNQGNTNGISSMPPQTIATVLQDKSGGGGGGIYTYRCIVDIENSNFISNLVLEGNGGAIQRDVGVSTTEGSNNSYVHKAFIFALQTFVGFI
ncbi:hypothetical protein RFI_20398, partial [Reticulomyxa filosa]